MKVFKIMSELLKLIEKNKTFECKYGIDEEYIYFYLMDTLCIGSLKIYG